MNNSQLIDFTLYELNNGLKDIKASKYVVPIELETEYFDIVFIEFKKVNGIWILNKYSDVF